MQIENPEWRTLTDEKQMVLRKAADTTIDPSLTNEERIKILDWADKRNAEIDQLLLATDRYIES